MKVFLIKNGKTVASINTRSLTGPILLDLAYRGYTLGVCPLIYFEVLIRQEVL